MAITFTSQDYLANHVKQVLRENQEGYEAKIFHNCSKKLENTYMPDFNRQIIQAKNNLSTKDKINILSTLKDAYYNAGRIKDSQILESQIKKLDIEG